jgi:hypothetical protein
MNKCEICRCNKICDHNLFGFEICDNFISEDVVEVVRCKDCKRYYPKKHEERVGWCEEIGIDMPYEHFCSYGERKVE